MPNPLKFLAVPAAVCLMAVPALSQDAETATATPDISMVVATVGETEITLGHMILSAAQLPQNYRNLPDDVLYEAVLDQLIREEAVAQTSAEDLSVVARLVIENQTRALRAGEALSKVSEGIVTDEKVQALYDQRFANVAPEPEFNASHILVETEEEAKALVEELSGGADFAELAKEKSTGPSGPNGGQLGWFGKGMMVQPFEAAVIAMEKDAISAPVQTQFGWHVIKLNDTRDTPVPTLDEMRDQLAAEVEQAAVEDAVEDIAASATVTRVSAQEIDPAAIRNMELLQN
ncbi:peptidylprolyl isomerase [Actibacterium pelagium]|uniref:Parvulin-like PPIase n=1 Tax=Actibacterium pelagium TaxID=2029103 RepID=A0A917EKT5_9RHOB|nr:peptidylprolyl isomerase [Actibacterium pelagium]GGE56317.1 peptidylprolyl isomerase [Actibacterium pelagium]